MEKAVPDPSMAAALFFYPSHLALFVIIYLCTYLKNPSPPLIRVCQEACPLLHGHEMLIRIFGMNGQCGQADP